MGNIAIVLLAIFVAYIVQTLRRMNDKLNSFKRSLDHRITNQDMEHVIKIIKKHMQNDLKEYLDSMRNDTVSVSSPRKIRLTKLTKDHPCVLTPTRKKSKK